MKKINKPFLLFLVMFLMFFIGRSIVHFNLKTGYFDQYFFDNPFWNTTQGRPLFLSIEQRSFLGNHFSPILFLFSLPYFICPSPLWSFAFQALFTSGMCVLIYLFAQKHLEKEPQNLILLMLFTNATVHYMGFNDFHMDVILTFLLTAAIYLLYTYKDLWGPTLLLLAGFLAKETAGILVASYGLFLFFCRKQKILGLLLLISGMAATAFIADKIIPRFNPTEHFIFGKYYSHFGNTTYEQISNMLFHPFNTLLYLFSSENIFYIFILLAPFAFLPLFVPQLLVLGAMPLFQNLISNYRFQKDLTTQYSYVFIPILFFATILAMKKMQENGTWEKNKARIKRCMYFFATIAVLAYLLFDSRLYIPFPNVFPAHKIMRQIPKDASVSASTHLLAHLQYRKELFLFPKLGNAEYVIYEDLDPLLPEDPDKYEDALKKFWQEKKYARVFRYLFLGASIPSDKEYIRTLRKVEASKDYTLIASENGIRLYRKKAAVTR